MLTIGKLGASRTQLEYYEQQVAAGIEDYYAGRGEAPGLWRGRGARVLGLGREVECDEFMALLRGRNPVDGTVLRPMGACSTVAALDLTFSAPKSVSVLFAIADEATASALLEAHERAVEATRADSSHDRDLDPVQNPDRAQANDNPPVKTRPRKPIQSRRDSRLDRGGLHAHDAVRRYARATTCKHPAAATTQPRLPAERPRKRSA